MHNVSLEGQMPEWYEDQDGYYGRNYFEAYAGHPAEGSTEAAIEFLATLLKRGDVILDVPCGYGRHALRLAELGFSVTGQDLNSFFIEKARETAKVAGVSIEYRQGDMRELPFSNRFDVALNIFTSFGYFLAERDNLAFLTAVRGALKSGGRFVLDFVNREKIIRGWKPHHSSVYQNGIRVEGSRTFDMVTGIEHSIAVHIHPDGSRKTVVSSQRLYTLPELIDLCQRAGLKPIETYGNFDGSPVSLESGRVILVAQKC